MRAYKAKAKRLSGTDFHDVNEKAYGLYCQIKKKSKRRPYVRSAYFKKDKIFLELFWSHLFEKQNWRDRIRRSRYFPAAIELIQRTSFEPVSKENPNRSSEILHRFSGITADSHLFFVQIKEEKRSGQKFFMSVFPESE